MSSSITRMLHSPPHHALPRRPGQPPRPRPNETVFRILCDPTTCRSLIGPSGAFVMQLQHDTGGSRIHCCDQILGCNELVVMIVGDKVVSRTMELVNKDNVEEKGVVFNVSCAQEALLRVVARVLEVEGSGVWCRMVVDGSQVGVVLGKGGWNLERIERETGARIVVSGPTGTACGLGLSPDQLIVISGDILAMNRALHAVSCCLQANPPKENYRSLSIGPAGTPYAALPSPHLEFSPYLDTNIPQYAGYSVPLNTNAVVSQSKKQEVVFRLLIHANIASGMIGHKGSVIRALENESHASIVCSSPLIGCQERVITITALEDLESCDSAAQRAILYVFKKSFDIDRSRNIAQARLLVELPFIHILFGDKGLTILQIEQGTGAGILITGGHHVPTCAVKDDVVVEISGDFNNVQNALVLVTTKLRDSLLTSEAANGGRLTIHPYLADPQFSTNGTVNEIVSSGSPRRSPEPSQESSISESIEKLRLSLKNEDSSLPKAADETERAAITENGAGLITSEVDSQHCRSAIIKKATMEIAVPQELFASIFVEDENNLAHMKLISGVELEVYQPEDNNGDGKIIVSGTPNQTMAAQNVLQAFILARQ